MLFLDLRKAFDTVNTEILLNKLKLSGLKSNVVKWFRSYLSGRSHVTRIGKEKSSPMPVTCGVPQGSILGPMLFTVYINDLPDTFNESSVSLYADDTAILFSHPDPVVLEHVLNEELARASNWFNHNKLSLNVKKSKFMLFGTKSQVDRCVNLKVKHGQKELERVSTFKYLGVKLDPNLSFKDHVQYIRGKVVPKIKLLGHVSTFLDLETRLSLYKSLVLPIFDYADTVYNCLSQQDSYSLQKMQNCAMRRILHCDRMEPINNMHTMLHLLPLNIRRQSHSLNETYKIVNGHSPAYLGNMLTYVSEVHSRTTRSTSSNMLYIPKTKLECCKRNFKIRASIDWNSVPDDIKSSATIDQFKKSALSYLIDNGDFWVP